MSCNDCSRSFNTGILAGVMVCVLFAILFNFASINSPEQSNYTCKFDERFAAHLNRAAEIGRNNVSYIDANEFLKQNSCPDCICEAECSSSASLRAVEGCHIPKKYFERKITIRDYTGFSNIPTLFEGNKIKTVDIKEKDVLIPGCFYGFEQENEMKVHRLMGNYPDYHIFRGDNNNGTEKVERENVKYLIIGVEFK